MTDETTHTDDHVADEHAADEHGHGGEALGPIDWAKWAFAVAGGVAGVIVLAFFVLALGGIPA